MENQPSKKSPFDFSRITSSMLIFGTLGIATIILVKSFWVNICLSFLIFLSVQFYKFYASSGLELEELSNCQLKEYLLTYQKLKRWVLYTGACILFCVLTYIYKPSKTLFAIPYFLSIIYLFFYAPIFIYYFISFASKHGIVAEAYAQRIKMQANDDKHSIDLQKCIPQPSLPLSPIDELIIPNNTGDPYFRLQNYIAIIQASLLSRHNRLLVQIQDILTI